MYIIEVIPIANIPLPHPQRFTYFYRDSLKRFSLVEIVLGKRNLPALVLNSSSLKDKKVNLKTGTFFLKKIKKILTETPAITEKNWDFFRKLANYYYVPLSALLKTALPAKLFTASHLKEVEHNYGDYENEDGKSKILFFCHNLKTREKKYIEIIQNFPAGKILFFAPEMYLLNHWHRKLTQEFTNKDTIIFHSGLSEKQKFETWQKVRSGDFDLLLGLRGSIYLPFPSLNLIVVDGEDNDSHKTWEGGPRTDTRYGAEILSKIFNAPLIKGGDNLNLIDQEKKCASFKPDFSLVDLREEIKNGNNSVISKELRSALCNVLKKQKKTFLFIARKGTSTITLCRDCGYIEKCRNCDSPLVYHETGNTLFCHHCGFQKTPPDLCPQCRGHKIRFLGAGTEKARKDIQNLFPETKIKIWENKIEPGEIPEETNIYSVSKYEVNVGTQLALKENFFSNLALVGVINMDTVLNLPDYGAREQAFRIIHRLNSFKNPNGGKMIIQTYQPDNDFFELIKNGNFPKKELEARKMLGYTPFGEIIKLTLRGRNNKKIETDAKILKEKLKVLNSDISSKVTILGPAPSFIPKKRNLYYWCIIIKNNTLSVQERNRFLKIVPSDWLIEIDPLDTL